MKRIFTLAALALSTFVFAQEQTTTTEADKTIVKQNTVSVRGMYGDPSQWGLSYEFGGLLTDDRSSNVVNVSYGTMNYEVDGADFDVDGQGFVIELGRKSFYGKQGKELKGFYSANYLSYGAIEFDEDFGPDNFKGTYSYFSFFSPEVGYKIMAGNFSIDPFIGIMWKIEVKGKGDIDNANTEEWVPRAGLKIGYSF